MNRVEPVLCLGLLLTGCTGGVPFIDDPPMLLALNGESPGLRTGAPLVEGWSGSVWLKVGDVPSLDLQIEAEDAEGDAFEVWFPAAPGVVDFDPAGREGRWVAPVGTPYHPYHLDLVLRQVDPPYRASWWELSLEGEADSADTGAR